jgi:hypothetical protein
MKRIVFWGLLVLYLPLVSYAQEKVDIPIWNKGDKWVFTDSIGFLKKKGTIEVLKADQSNYIVKFSDGICVFETQGFETILFEKSTLHRNFALRENKREKYNKGRRTLLNFPLNPGKKWKDGYSAVSLVKGVDSQLLDYYEIYEVLGWEEVEVKAGKFRAIKLEVTTGHEAKGSISAFEATNLYWYSPDVKNLVKCEYDPISRGISADLFNWELTSFKIKK